MTDIGSESRSRDPTNQTRDDTFFNQSGEETKPFVTSYARGFPGLQPAAAASTLIASPLLEPFDIPNNRTLVVIKFS